MAYNQTVDPGAPPINGRVQPDGAHTGPVNGATTPELIGRLINDVSELVDKQIELAKQEIRDEIGGAVDAIKTLAIFAGIAVVLGLLALIYLWTGIIWFFNWVGAFFGFGGLGWLVAPLLLAAIGFFAYSRFLKPGIRKVKALWPPLQRTRTTLKEDLEWVRQLRTPSAR